MCEHKKVWIYQSEYTFPGRIHICISCYQFMRHRRNAPGWKYFPIGYSSLDKEFIKNRPTGWIIDNV